MSTQNATLKLDGKDIVLPIVVGTEGERGVDVRKLRDETSYITFDDGYANTGACESKVTFIDGEKGILRYRGYGIEELAEKSNFIETAYLLIYGELPTTAQLTAFKARILDNSQIHEGLRIALSGFPGNAHPMAVLSATLNTLGCYYPELGTNERTHDLAKFDETAAVLISKVRTLAALAYRSKEGEPPVYPKPGLDYCSNFLHLLFSQPNADYAVHPEIARARLVVEGEIWLSRKRFDQINLEREKRGEAPFANPRNMAAGTLRQLEVNQHVQLTASRGADRQLHVEHIGFRNSNGAGAGHIPMNKVLKIIKTKVNRKFNLKSK